MAAFVANIILGASFALCIYFFRNYMKEANRPMNWWKWCLTIIWGIMVLFVFAYIGTTIGEGAPQAAATGGPFLGIITAVAGAILFRFILFPKPKNNTTTS